MPSSAARGEEDLREGKAVGVSALCVATNDSKSATLTVVASGATGITEDYGDSSAKYSSFSDCMSDLSRVLQNAQSDNQDILGAVCEPSDSGNGIFLADLYSTMP